MATNIKTFGRVISTSPKCVSYYGNPSRYVTFETSKGEELTGYTASNADCGYGCDNSNLKEFAIIEYHYTKGGDIVITRIDGKPSEYIKGLFRERKDHKICRNAKRNNLLNDIFESILDKNVNYDDLYSGIIGELKRYKNEFRKELDYNYVQYGNLLIGYYEVRDLFEKFGYNTKHINDDKIWLMYEYTVREVIDYILENEIYIA